MEKLISKDQLRQVRNLLNIKGQSEEWLKNQQEVETLEELTECQYKKIVTILSYYPDIDISQGD